LSGAVTAALSIRLAASPVRWMRSWRSPSHASASARQHACRHRRLLLQAFVEREDPGLERQAADIFAELGSKAAGAMPNVAANA
jgi:hypothetical protein